MISREQSRDVANRVVGLLAAHTIGPLRIKILTVLLSRRIFLTRRLYPRQDPNAQQNDGADDNPGRGYMHQVRAVS